MGRKEQKDQERRVVGHRQSREQDHTSEFTLTEFDEVTNAKSLLNNVGLDFPPLPLDLEPSFKQRDRWCFSTKPVTLSPYCFDEYVRDGTMSSAQDYMLFCHAGHGANSYAWHYYLVSGQLRLFLQLGCGGAYMNPDGTTRAVNECFGLASRLFTKVRERRDAGRLRSDDRLIIVGSEFYGSYWIPGGERRRSPHGERLCVKPSVVLAEALRWLNVGLE